MIDKSDKKFQERVQERMNTPAYAARAQEALQKGIASNTSEHIMSVLHDAEDELEREDEARGRASKTREELVKAIAANPAYAERLQEALKEGANTASVEPFMRILREAAEDIGREALGGPGAIETNAEREERETNEASFERTFGPERARDSRMATAHGMTLEEWMDTGRKGGRDGQ